MSFGPVDRRSFLSGGAGAFVCTLAGQKIASDGPEADLEQLAAGIEVPPKVRGASFRQNPLAPAPAPASGGARREYWVVAQEVRWNIVPTKRDEMMNRRVKEKAKFKAFVYREFTENFGAPKGPAGMPGALLEAETGDTLVVNFRNDLKVPATMHPHGVVYTPEMDGAYKGKFTDPGGFVQPGKTFQYVWDCREGTEGVWPYHDHGPVEPMTLFKGLFGFINIRKKGAPRPDVEHYLVLHSLATATTGLTRGFQCVNGRSYAGNTPELRAKVGQRVAQHVTVMNNDFHTYHLHGHRWKNEAGKLVDNETLGPADSLTLEFVEDNPGRWFYHCHVFSHLHEGMNGWYLVEP